MDAQWKKSSFWVKYSYRLETATSVSTSHYETIANAAEQGAHVRVCVSKRQPRESSLNSVRAKKSGRTVEKHADFG